jgi:sulfite exporter TauE/SafE
MKFEFVKDGAIQGWVISFAFTLMTMALLLAGFFSETIKNGWREFGGNYYTLYLGSTGIWLSYRGLKSYTEYNYRKIELKDTGLGSAKFPD